MQGTLQIQGGLVGWVIIRRQVKFGDYLIEVASMITPHPYIIKSIHGLTHNESLYSSRELG